MKNLIRSLCLLVSVTLLACSSSQADWSQANAQGTAAGYQDFLNKHPNDPNAAVARQRLQVIQDGQAWITAQTTNSVEGYQQYIAAEPQGANVQVAHSQIMALQRAAAWSDTKDAGTSSALQAFLLKYPQGPEADLARTQLAQFDYVVQIGVYPNAKQADDARAKLQDNHGKDLQNVVVVAPTGKAKIYRIVSADMTQEQAKTACASLRKDHQRCEVVKRASNAASPG